VPWSLPYSIPFEASRVIFIWAATNNGAFNYTGNWTWFTQWWHVFPFFARQAFIFTLGLFLLNQLLWLRLRGRVQRDWSATILSLIAVPSLVFWFFMAPSYRLSGSLIWIFFAAELMATFQWVTQAGWVTRPHLAALALVVVVSLWQSPNQFSNNISRRLLFLPPTEQQLDEAAHPLALYQQRVTDSGLAVYIPAPGVEECWNAPLPCTTAANFSPNIHTLKPGDLQSGFSRKQTR
jgi:hypothetical protein